MSSLSFLSVCLSGASMILLLTAVSRAQDDDFTPAPEYDSDYSPTFEYSFYSNGSSEDLEKFSEPFLDLEEEEAVTTTTTTGSTEGDDVRNSSSLPVSLAIRTLVWTLMIMISVNLQQLQHTL